MRGKLPWVLLAISLAVNLAFIAGAIHFEATEARMADDPGERVARLAAELKLAPDQREALSALHERMAAGREQMRGAMQERRQMLLAELARPELDQARVETFLREGAELRVARFATMAGEMHRFLASLTPQQKTAFLELAREPDFFRRLMGRPSHSPARQAQ